MLIVFLNPYDKVNSLIVFTRTVEEAKLQMPESNNGLIILLQLYLPNREGI